MTMLVGKELQVFTHMLMLARVKIGLSILSNIRKDEHYYVLIAHRHPSSKGNEIVYI